LSDGAISAVLVTSGNSGSQAGNISTNGFTSHTFPNLVSKTITVTTGSGNAFIFVGDITLSGGLKFPKAGGQISLQADRNVALSNDFDATTISVTQFR
jgi:hypothetical protein